MAGKHWLREGSCDCGRLSPVGKTTPAWGRRHHRGPGHHPLVSRCAERGAGVRGGPQVCEDGRSVWAGAQCAGSPRSPQPSLRTPKLKDLAAGSQDPPGQSGSGTCSSLLFPLPPSPVLLLGPPWPSGRHSARSPWPREGDPQPIWSWADPTHPGARGSE